MAIYSNIHKQLLLPTNVGVMIIIDWTLERLVFVPVDRKIGEQQTSTQGFDEDKPDVISCPLGSTVHG